MTKLLDLNLLTQLCAGLFSVIIVCFSYWYTKHASEFAKKNVQHQGAVNAVNILGKLATAAVDKMETTDQAGEDKMIGAVHIVNIGLESLGLKGVFDEAIIRSFIETAVKVRKAFNANDPQNAQNDPKLTQIVDDNKGSDSAPSNVAPIEPKPLDLTK